MSEGTDNSGEGKVRNRAAEIDAEWRRIERQELLTGIVYPALVYIGIPAVALGTLYYFYPTTTNIIMAAITAIGMPLTMWAGRRK